MPNVSSNLPLPQNGAGGHAPSGSSASALLDQAKAEQAAAVAKRKGLDVKHEAPDNAPWEVPTFPRGFDLHSALEKAYGKATKYINNLVTEQGYAVSFEQRDGNTPVGRMIDIDKNQIVKEYDARQMLKLYAEGPGGKGFIIDGKI